MWKKALLIALFASLALPLQAEEPHPYASPALFGEPVWIGENEQRYPAIFGPATSHEARGVVILLHAANEHPQWPKVIQVLREDLADHQWNTLALQLPVPLAGSNTVDAEKLVAQMQQRLALAVDYAMQTQPLHLVLIGHGMGANAAMNLATATPPPNLLALVAISLNASPYAPEPLNGARALENLQLPILDVMAERDRLEIIQSRKQRSRAARMADNKDYRQLVIPGVGHHYYAQATLLSKRVRSWLDARYKAYRPPSREAMKQTIQVVRPPMATPPGQPMMGERLSDTREAAQTNTTQVEEAIPQPGPAVEPTEKEENTPNPTGPGGLF
ncbi:MAG: DUF3530 family protein [Gammaproteobacteria bacterium]|nr:DUF3530 family protein [Gammaproteobacteria bacterium]